MKTPEELEAISVKTKKLCKEMHEVLGSTIDDTKDLCIKCDELAAIINNEDTSKEDALQAVYKFEEYVHRIYNNYEVVGPFLMLFMGFPWRSVFAEHDLYMKNVKEFRDFSVACHYEHTVDKLIERQDNWPFGSIASMNKESYDLFVARCTEFKELVTKAKKPARKKKE